jgi:hypothetical protein
MQPTHSAFEGSRRKPTSHRRTSPGRDMLRARQGGKAAWDRVDTRGFLYPGLVVAEWARARPVLPLRIGRLECRASLLSST